MVSTRTRTVRKYTGTHAIQRRRVRQACAYRYPTRTMITRSHRKTSSGFSFHHLPAEVFAMILDRLSVVEVSVFSMVSKAISKHVVEHISTLTWRNKMILQSVHHSLSPADQSSSIRHYTELGLLFKRCTLLLPTKDRLKFIQRIFSQIPCFMLEQCTATECLGFSSCGVFLQTLIAGWDELECHRVYSFICNLTNLPRKIEMILNGIPGATRYLEIQIRLFCRQVLLDVCNHRKESLFWLTQILKPWPMVSQARLLFLIYGPLLPDCSVSWQEQVRSVLPPSALWDLSKAVLLLHSDWEVTGWTTDTMLSILEELTVLPWSWHMENVARLLVMCGNSLCFSFLANKALNGRMIELSRLIICIIMVCEKDSYCMSWAVKMVQNVCQLFKTSVEKWTFIQNLENRFSEVTMETYDFAMGGNHEDDVESFQNLCIMLNSSAHFHTEILHMFLRK